MKKKLFCVSDIHGFYDELREALDAAGFDPNNEEHWLIGCGDYMDRGRQPQQVIDYLMSLPRKILVRGNHEDLLLDCINRGYPLSHDISNGTAQTIADLAPDVEKFNVVCAVAYEKVKDLIDSMVDYVELKNYVFCHGFLPLNCDDGLPAYYQNNRKFSKMENWREASTKQWEDARWLNGMKMVDEGFGIDKTIVVGHFHSSWGRTQFEGKPEFGEGSDFSPYYYKDKLIAIDSCVAYTGRINCLVLEDDFIDD